MNSQEQVSPQGFIEYIAKNIKDGIPDLSGRFSDDKRTLFIEYVDHVLSTFSNDASSIWPLYRDQMGGIYKLMKKLDGYDGDELQRKLETEVVRLKTRGST